MNEKIENKILELIDSGKTIKNYRKRADFILMGRPTGVKVPSESPGDLEKALKVFKRQQKDQGTFDELIKINENFYKNASN